MATADELEDYIQTLLVRLDQFPDYYYGERRERALALLADYRQRLNSLRE